MKPLHAYLLSCFAFIFTVSGFFIIKGTPEFQQLGTIFAWVWAIYFVTITPLEMIK